MRRKKKRGGLRWLGHVWPSTSLLDGPSPYEDYVHNLKDDLVVILSHKPLEISRARTRKRRRKYIGHSAIVISTRNFRKKISPKIISN